MNGREISVIAGKSENYMYVLKSAHKERYNILKKYGIKEFEDMCKEAKNKLADIYWEIKETKGISFSGFYRSSSKIQESYKSIPSFIIGVSNFAFAANERTSVKGFNKMSIIIEEYEKYKAGETKC